VLHGAFSRLEPCAVKVASTVLRGRGDRKVTLLPDGWDLHTQIREEVALTAGKILVRGSKYKRGPSH
jgi:hypothetical protein